MHFTVYEHINTVYNSDVRINESYWKLQVQEEKLILLIIFIIKCLWFVLPSHHIKYYYMKRNKEVKVGGMYDT